MKEDVRRGLDAWNNFWFRPADPSMLGLMRIMTGIFLVYTHLAYCFDLDEFFGRSAWYDREAIEHFRHHGPVVTPQSDWVVPQQSVRLPEDPTARKAVVGWLRSLPDTAAERHRWLRYIDALPDDPAQHTFGLEFGQRVSRAYDEPAELEKQLQLMVTPPEDEAERDRAVPRFLVQLPPAERQAMRLRLLDTLKTMPPESAKRDQVWGFLMSLPVPERRQVVRFAYDLPSDRAEREHVLSYREFWNLDPRQVGYFGMSTWSVWFHVSNPAAMKAVHAGFLCVMVLFTLGVLTRVTSVLTWLAAVSYINRSEVVLFGQDTMMNILLVYLMLSPCGAALSVDRLIARYRAARALGGAKRQSDAEALERVLAGPVPSSSANFVTRLFQIHFCFIYMAAGLSKLKGPAWWNHTAIWYTVANPEFSPTNTQVYNWFLYALAGNRPLLEAFQTLGVAFTLGMELALPFLVWNKALRPWMALGGFLLHLGIAGHMGLTVFSVFMMTLLLSYLPPWVVRERVEALGAGLARLRVAFDARSVAQSRQAALVRALDVWNQAEVVERKAGKDAPVEPLEVSVNGEPVRGGAAVRRLAESLRLTRSLAWLLRLPGLSRVGRTPRA